MYSVIIAILSSGTPLVWCILVLTLLTSCKISCPVYFSTGLFSLFSSLARAVMSSVILFSFPILDLIMSSSLSALPFSSPSQITAINRRDINNPV